MSTSAHSMFQSRFNRRSLLAGSAAAAVALALPRSISARYPGAPGYAHPEWLIDAGSLMDQIDRTKVVAFTPVEEYVAGHIPGAAQIDFADLAVTDTSEPSITSWRSQVETTLARLNITPGDAVVLYDGGTLLSARLWWILDMLGHRNVRLLNGGLMAWKVAGGEIETGSSRVEPALDPYAGATDHRKLATLDEVVERLADPGVAFLDARNPDEFAVGHIPGAINYAFPLNAEARPPRVWKQADLLMATYAGMGITPDKDVIAYCATGVRSSVSYFALRLIGYPSVRVYTGSWNEWSEHDDLPVETGS